MFNLKYKITDADMKAVNKRIMWQFFIPYVIVALLGVAAGIAATVLQPHNELFVLGIILIVLASVLLVCAVLMTIAPKNFVASALSTSDDVERDFVIDERGVAIKTPDAPDIFVSYVEVSRVRDKKTYALLYVGKDTAILVKDAIVDGGTFPELVAYLKEKTGRAPQSAPATQQSEKLENAEVPADEQTEQTETAEENSDVQE